MVFKEDMAMILRRQKTVEYKDWFEVPDVLPGEAQDRQQGLLACVVRLCQTDRQ